MEETIKQYIERLTSYVKAEEAFATFKATPELLHALVAGEPDEILLARPREGKWSAAEILGHLAESEIVLAYRIRMVLSVRGTPLQAMDQDRWQENAGYLRKDPRRALELFRVARESNIALLESIPRDRWKDHGVHSERGEESIERMVHLYAGHDINHHMQIEKNLKAAQRGAT